MNKPLTKKQKLIEKVKNLDTDLGTLDARLERNAQILHPSSLINNFFSILDSLPNRVLAKIIRDAKADLNLLKIEEKQYKREQKLKDKQEVHWLMQELGRKNEKTNNS